MDYQAETQAIIHFPTCASHANSLASNRKQGLINKKREHSVAVFFS